MYFKVLNNSTQRQREIYFRKLNLGKKSKVEENKSARDDELDDELVHSIRTFQYLDKQLYSCKTCEYLTDEYANVENHIYNFHILPKRRMSEQDIVIHYIE